MKTGPQTQAQDLLGQRLVLVKETSRPLPPLEDYEKYLCGNKKYTRKSIRKDITPDLMRRIVEMRRNSICFREIGLRYGVGQGAVYSWYRKLPDNLK